MNIPLSPCVSENLVSRDDFGSPVPRQPAHLHTQAESCFLPPLLGTKGLKCIATCRTGTQEKRVKLLPKRVQLPLWFFVFVFVKGMFTHKYKRAGSKQFPSVYHRSEHTIQPRFRTDRSLYAGSSTAFPSWPNHPGREACPDRKKLGTHRLAA